MATGMVMATMMMSMNNGASDANQTVAAFLITRPPYAYLGFGWESDDRQWNDLFWLQAGQPAGLCVEAPSGVFSREWSLGTATLDCNCYSADLSFQSLVV